jgi:hypothetical protein
MNQSESVIISRVTQRLYRSAQSIVVLYTIVGVLLALVCGFLTGPGFDMRAIPGAVILGALGYAIGSYRTPSS